MQSCNHLVCLCVSLGASCHAGCFRMFIVLCNRLTFLLGTDCVHTASQTHTCQCTVPLRTDCSHQRQMPSPESTSGQGGPNSVRRPTQFRVMTLHFISSQWTQIMTLKMEFWGTKTKCCKSSTGKLVEACSVQGFKQGRSVHWRSALLSLGEKVKQGETDVILPRGPNVLSLRNRKIKRA